uniref:Tim44-like domain-containing protein n=1 Tax=Peronospora matthiolae TaxID=2874970 RepID=A0AAV1TTW1_9STRA
MHGLHAARRRLLLLHRQYIVPTHSKLTNIRHFTSSHESKTPQQLEKGFDLATGLWHRCTSRLSTLSEYQDKKIFNDSLSPLAQYWLFVQLQLPKETQINLLEFVEGASVAAEATLRAMNCDAFPKVLASEGENSLSEVEDKIKMYTTPAHYNKMALQVKRNYLHRNFYIECEDMKIERAQVANAVYRRLTEKEYLDLVNFGKPVMTISPEASIEHLSINVDIATVEDLKVVHLKNKPRYVQHQNVYRVVLESRVTDHDKVDWRVENMHLIEQAVVPRTTTGG